MRTGAAGALTMERLGPEGARKAPASNAPAVRLPTDKEVRNMVLASSGFWLWTIIAVAIWIAIAFWPARVAARKGHSFFGYFVFSLIFFPAALIVAYIVKDKTASA
jgi:hypothetical protein